MVALLQNSQTRENQATQHKLNALADGVADLMEHLSDHYDDDDLMRDTQELRDAVGLESRGAPPTTPRRSSATPTTTVPAMAPYQGRIEVHDQANPIR